MIVYWAIVFLTVIFIGLVVKIIYHYVDRVSDKIESEVEE